MRHPEQSLPAQEMKTERGTLRMFAADALPGESAQKFLRFMKESIQTPERYLDQGGAAKVYRFSENVCVKVLENRDSSPVAAQMLKANPVQVEAALQNIASQKIIAGVRAPQCLGYFQAQEPGAAHAILMEQLDAVNVQHVLNGSEPLPKNFQVTAFVNALSEFMDHLHEKIGMFHNDLAPRNVMIDRRTAAPYVIDFGRAKVARLISPVERKRLWEADQDSLDILEEKLHNFTEKV